MKLGLLRHFSPLVWLMWGLLPVSGNPALAQGSCVSAQCHANILKGKNVHPATESCDSCHEAVSKPHPQKGKKTFKLTDEPPALCNACHEAFGKKADVHPPAKEGKCLACHDPHSSDHPTQLVKEAAELCAGCHPKITQVKVPHGPVS